MRVRHILQNLTLAIASLIVLFLVLEFTLRATRLFGARVSYSKPDPILAYRFAPGADYSFHRENPKAITGRINNFGWRDVDWMMKKPPGTLRIAVLGDSFVEAFQVELESTFVKIAERKLSTIVNSTVEVMNFGRSGFTQTEELLVLQSDILKFSPDVVVVFFLPENDIDDVRKETAPDHERPFFLHNERTDDLILDASFQESNSFKAKMFMDGFKRNSLLVSLLMTRYTAFMLREGIREGADRAEQRSTKLSGFMSLCSAHPDSELRKNYAMNKILIGHMAQICNNTGVQCLLACFPTDAYLPEREKELRRADSTFNADFFDDDLGQLSSSLQIHYLGLQRTFRQAYGQNRRSLRWTHLNYEGHRVTGEALANALLPILVSQSSTQR